MSIDQPQPPQATIAPAEPASGLATYFGVLFSPGEAFETLARVPMWGWACVLGLIITVVSAIVGMPATLHVAQIVQQSQIAQSPADQQQAMRDAFTKISPIFPGLIVVQSIILSWIFWVIISLVILAGAAVGGGVARFANAWVLTVNAYAISVLGLLINNVILRLQGAENLSKITDAFALPSLAMLFHGDTKMAAFLYTFNVVNVWYYIVLAFGIRKLMKVGAVTAGASTIAVALVIALIASVAIK